MTMIPGNAFTRIAKRVLPRSGLRRLLLLLGVAPLLFSLYVAMLIPLTPSISDIRKAALEQPAQIFSADGVLLTEFKQANRQWIPLGEISPLVIDALIATEDRRFYEHHGIDWVRLASSLVQTLLGDRQGGSTLTQQLARNLYPEEIGRAISLNRKIKEAITAFKIESVHSKTAILEAYLNTVPFLYNAWGIEMAARTYFDTSATRLDALQGATLVGMLKGNSYYNPVRNPERALQRRNTVLALMVRQGKLDPAHFEILQHQPLGIDFERQPESLGPAPHFALQLRKWLIDWADRNDYDLYRDGLVVHTTLDSRLQILADEAVNRHAARLQQFVDATWAGPDGWHAGQPLVATFLRESAAYRARLEAGMSPTEALAAVQNDAAFLDRLREQKTRLQAGFLAIDPRNGQVKAWVGGLQFEQDAFDHVQQARRQPGSTFKPFVYGEAFRQGMSPDDTMIDQAVAIPLGGGEIWRPTDGKAPSGRAMRLRSALAYSKNTITAQLMQKVGAGNVAGLARAMGVRQSRMEIVPSLALGTSLVTLREMVSAYGTIANGGSYLEPVMVTRIEDRRGRILEEIVPPRAEAVLGQPVAYTLADAMRDVIDRGTGSEIRSRHGIYADVAGKTGTTQNNTDGWFILMHPQLVAGAWVGFNDSRITMRSDYWGSGARSALPMVGEFFRAVLQNRLIDAEARFGTPEQQARKRLPRPPQVPDASGIASGVDASGPAADDIPQQDDTAESGSTERPEMQNSLP